MVEYYDEIQIGEYDNGEPISIRITEIYTPTSIFKEEAPITIFGTIK